MTTRKQASVTERAIAQAQALLRTSKCTYIIYDEDGNEIANTVPHKAGRKSGVQYKPHFKPYIDELNGEGIVNITIPEDFEDVVAYRAALAGYLHAEFGPGNYFTSLHKDTRVVEVMVTKPPTDEQESGVDIDAAHKQQEPEQAPAPEPQHPTMHEAARKFQRAPRPLNPVLPEDIATALRGVPDFSKVQ